jgi:3-phosphoshikimate 1-carboxyvinyltransferase
MADATVTIRPARNLNGSVRLPGDKSISHRYAMLAAIAEGTSKFENFSSAADCASTIECVRALGCKVDQHEGVVAIEGKGGALNQPASPLDCGNSGSTMRMLSGILAGQAFETTLVGDESLSRRPMGRVIHPLRQMGASVSSADGERPPLRIKGSHLHAIEYKMPVASAQVKSCVLFAGLHAAGTTTIEEAVRTRDHSELALRAFGAELSRTRTSVSINGGQKLHAVEAYIPGDISSAAFFLCAALLFPTSNLIIDNLLLNPTRAVLLDVLTAMGGQISFLRLEDQHRELTGTVQFRSDKFKGGRIEGAHSVALVDELPVLAAIAPYSQQGIEIRDARELRVKESDRIAACIHNLRAMGAEVEEQEDGMRIPGNQRLHGAELQSFGDHRIAMAFSIAALRAEGDSVMHNADASSVSYPEFFSTLDAILER